MPGFKVADGYVEVDVDYAALDKSVAGLEARLKSIRAAIAVDPTVDQKAVDKALAEIQVKLNALKIKALSTSGIDRTELDTALAEIQARLEAFSAVAKVNLEVTGVPKAMAELQLVRAAADEAAGDTSGGGFTGLTVAGRGFWGVLGLLGTRVPLFGGYLSSIPFLGAVSGFHILGDAVAEVLAEVVPAGIALGVFGVAASGTIRDIVRQEQAYATVNEALKTSFPGVASGLQKFTDSVKPQVYVLFGEALDTINKHTDLFQTLAKGTGSVLDQLGARAELALGGSGLEGLLGKGVQDVQQLGTFIGNVFGIFGNLLKAMPGYAQYLFGALDSVSAAIEHITGSSIVQTLLQIGLGFHGIVLWGGLAATAVIALGKSNLVAWAGGVVVNLAALGLEMAQVTTESGLLAGAMVALDAVNPVFWVGLAIAGLTAFVIWLVNTKSAAQQSYDAVENLATAASSFTQVTNVLTQGLQQTNSQLKEVPKRIQVMTMGMHGQISAGVQQNMVWSQLQGNAKAYTSQLGLQSTRLGELNKITGSTANTQSAFAAIGIKNYDLANLSASAYKQVTEEVQAYQNATIQLTGYTAGPARAAQNALTNMYMQETVPAIQKVTNAETALMAVITGGASAYDQFQLNIATLNSNLGAAEKTVGTASHSIDGIRSSVSLAGAAMGGTSQASYALNQAFYSQVTAGQGVISALMQQSISTKDLSKVVATTVGQMLQYAGSNTAARSTLVDLINNALGPGTVTLKSLNQWVGTNSVSLSTMNGIVGQSTIKAGQLNRVLSTTLQNMQAVALFQAAGGQQAWNTFVTDVQSGKTHSDAFRTSTEQVMQQLYIQSNNSLPAAKRAFEDFAQNALGLTKKQADTLWQQTLPSLQKTINNLHGKTVDVGLTTSGAGQIIITGTGISTRTINTKTGQVNAFGGHTAKGGYINVGTTPTADDVLLFGSKGELMVPANIVNAGLVDHLRGLIPGFATGGIVPSPNISAPVSAVGNAESQIGAAEVVFGQAAATAFSSAALAAVKAAAATLAAGVPVAYSKIAGVTQWEPDVLRALAMLGLSAADLPTVMAQILTESGGNPNAINLTDINAQQGDPSRGLLQTIMTTFQAYRSPALSANIYDPMANIYAALNYAIHRYGNPGWLSVLGHGHGYATGGFMPAGHSGVVGEAGIEAMYARPGGGVDIVPLGGGGKTITQYFQYYGTQYPTAEMTAQQRRDMAMALAVAP